MTDKKCMNPHYNKNVNKEENQNEHHILCEAHKKQERIHNKLLNETLKPPDQLHEERVAVIVRKYRELHKNIITNNGHKEEDNEDSKVTNSLVDANTCSNKVSDETIRPFDSRETYDLNYRNTKNEKNIWTKQMANDCCNKTTYCRPIVSYNQEFIYKTLEKNSRLKRLVKQLALARQQERGRVLWNNYINDLKSKHGYNRINNRHSILIQDREEITPETIENYYNTKFDRTFSKPRNVLLDELYAANSSYSKSVNQESQVNNDYISMYRQTFPNDSLCYPMSSQRRLYALQRESIGKRFSKNRASEAKLDENTVLTQPLNTNSNTKFKSTTTQADIQKDQSIGNPFKYNNDKAVIGDIEKDSEHLLVHKNQKQKKSSKCKSVISIESKLETLIESVNTFINEMKLHRERSKENNALGDKNYKTIQYDVHEIAKKKPEFYDTISKGFKNDERQITKDESIYEPDKVFQSIPLEKVPEFHNTRSTTYSEIMNLNENIFRNSYTTNLNKNNQECSVQISFEIPTRDCSTEVTKSLSHQIYVNKNVPEKSSAITVAINTDPLSLIALLKISSDTLKGLLSFVPNIDYHSYLSYLPLPKLQWGEAHCNCPDMNTLNSLLLNNSGCVYQQLFDKAFVGPFKCKYCGKTFTRAYCWELHQLTCARSLGRRKDDPSLMLLK